MLASSAQATPRTASSTELAPLSACPGQANATAAAGVKLAAMHCLVNWTRRRHGLRPLRNSRPLDRSSSLRANAIRRCGQFSHTPCGQSFGAVFATVGYSGSFGETLAWGGGPLGSARSALQMWLGSPSHRRTILQRGWRDLGLKVVRADRLFGAADVSLWVAQFGRR